MVGPTINVPFAEVWHTRGFDAAKHFYRRSVEQFPGRYRTGLSDLDLLGRYVLHERNEPERAVQVLTFNVELYPDEAQGWDSLARATVAIGDREAAARHFQKALELDGGLESARKGLKELQSER